MEKNSKHKMEVILRESEERYRRLFETAQDGILILNSKTGQITDVNPYLITLLGYSKAEFLDKKLWEVGAFRNIKAARDVFKILQKDGYIRYEDLPLETKDGRLVSVEFVSNSYKTEDTLVIQCNIRNITERKKTEFIKESKNLLEAERARLASIADATHELRTPVAIIKGNVDLAMQRHQKSPMSALRAINYEIKHLSNILTDLSLITSEAWELKNRLIYEKINLKSLIVLSVKRCKVLASGKKISISSEAIPSLTILGDRFYLEKMLVNLIKNSIIYGFKRGHTKITAKKSKGFVSIIITDDGIGISKKDLPYVFERFYKAEESHSISGKSVGLGLAIVKWVAEIHGGTVSAKSLNKKGSVFNVFLPMKDKSN